MSTTDASPREAATEATAAAVAWLERYLAEGPRYSAALRRDAVADGIQLPALHRAGDELSVCRIQASRWSRWALPQHAEVSAEKRCPICGEIRDREDFRRPPAPSYPMGRMMPVCNPCSEARSCRTDCRSETETETETETEAGTKRCSMCGVRQPLDMFSRATGRKDGRYPSCRPCRAAARRPGASPNLTEALIDRTASHAPDPGPARTLRCELARQRAAGRPWASAWPRALHLATDGLPAREASSWRSAFSATSAAWASSYHRHAAVAAHGGLAALAAAA